MDHPLHTGRLLVFTSELCRIFSTNTTKRELTYNTVLESDLQHMPLGVVRLLVDDYPRKKLFDRSIRVAAHRQRAVQSVLTTPLMVGVWDFLKKIDLKCLENETQRPQKVVEQVSPQNPYY